MGIIKDDNKQILKEIKKLYLVLAERRLKESNNGVWLQVYNPLTTCSPQITEKQVFHNSF